MIVSTYESVSDEDIPAEFLAHPISSLFECANIQYFKTNEIQSLMQRWFQFDLKIDDDEQLNQLIKNFHHLNIPSTPLAVSMFLWIYEKQKEFRPVNNASMLQNFIEKLFEKHSPSEVYSGDFDFHNKDNLLSNIAMEMYKQDNINYSIESTNLQKFIKELYERKKMRVEIVENKPFHEWVLEYFVKKGILISEIYENTRIYKFKLNCFFQYYLAKAMNISPLFKEEVLNANNYLMFDNEIDYYTGLQRHRGDILELVVSRMEKEYEKFLQKSEFEGDIFQQKEIPTFFDGIFSIGDSKRQPLLIERLEENELDEYLAENKLTEEDKNKENDSLLDVGNDSDSGSIIINKIPQNHLEYTEILQKSWMLAARVLKNSEELEDGDLKDRAFRSILICSLLFLAIHKIKVDQLLKRDGMNIEKENPEIASFYYFFSRFGLGLHETLLHSVIGTSKLTPVISDYLENNLTDQNVSNVEKFTAIFLYIDSKADDFKDLLNTALQKNVSNSVKDFVFMKLTLLHASTKKNDEERYFRNKLNELIMRSRSGFVIKKQKIISSHQNRREKEKLLEQMRSLELSRKN